MSTPAPDRPAAGRDDLAEQSRPSPFHTIVFMVASFPLRLVQFVLIFTLTAVGIVTTIVWVGIPILLATTYLTRWFGDVERRWVRSMLNTNVPDVERLKVQGGLLRRWLGALTDPTTWRDFGYLMLVLPLGILEFAIGLVSIILVPMAIWVAPALGWLHGRMALTLLGPPKARKAEARASRLQASRARGVDAAEAERRRIERDLHDGAQQRLVSVAMSLGRAKSKLSGDPDDLRSLIDEAHTDAKLAVSELRDLARGIYPAVLADRGLDAALSAQAAKSPIHVDVTVDVEPRPPAAVETTAYFIVGETLTNVAKHAGATEAGVKVWRTEDTVVVEVTDNGNGGARMREGGGLAGLADRAATIDGVISVVSPPGGPTVVRADLPCTW
ncbi:histidine kinase [Prauserella marina]|uniref:histidine kinase n=1 Tax=Prauserella marina TaxID=530584 RepID=A0A222VKI8_9PSEU|nr:sensor histidine kinase [Prauserella marina]ASR34425.1 histidine kinase [Prauserella marina]PWV70981.1 signal transduction histidine kinase [Prauserella marina]SDE00273.1 Signal transduction histidine kinase [Prauserella marina]